MTDTIHNLLSTVVSLMIGGLILLFTSLLISRLRREGVIYALRSMSIEFIIIIIFLLVNMFLGCSESEKPVFYCP